MPDAAAQETPDLQDKILKSLHDIRDVINKEFPGAAERLDQFNDHIDTAMMAVEYLFDEAERMPNAGYRLTQAQKDQARAERQKVIDQMRQEGATI